MTTPKLQGGNRICPFIERTNGAKCGKKHEGKCLTDIGFS